jgi:hypothetical protein
MTISREERVPTKGPCAAKRTWSMTRAMCHAPQGRNDRHPGSDRRLLPVMRREHHRPDKIAAIHGRDHGALPPLGRCGRLLTSVSHAKLSCWKCQHVSLCDALASVIARCRHLPAGGSGFPKSRWPVRRSSRRQRCELAVPHRVGMVLTALPSRRNDSPHPCRLGVWPAWRPRCGTSVGDACARQRRCSRSFHCPVGFA